jgi:hypothetical protein
MIKFLQKLAVVSTKKPASIFAKKFGENIIKIITLVSDLASIA